MTRMRRLPEELLQLHDAAGQCKHLTFEERKRFLEQIAVSVWHTRTLCLIPDHAGTRLSDLLQLIESELMNKLSFYNSCSSKKWSS